MEGRVGTRAHFQRKKYLNIYYTDTFWTNFIYCRPTFKNKKFSRGALQSFRKWCLLFVASWLLGQRLFKSNQFVTSLPLFSLTTSHPSTQILLTPFCSYPQKLIHCFALLRNEWVKKARRERKRPRAALFLFFRALFFAAPWLTKRLEEAIRRGREYFSQKLYSFVKVFFDIVDPEVNFWH